MLASSLCYALTLMRWTAPNFRSGTCVTTGCWYSDVAEPETTLPHGGNLRNLHRSQFHSVPAVRLALHRIERHRADREGAPLAGGVTRRHPRPRAQRSGDFPAFRWDLTRGTRTARVSGGTMVPPDTVGREGGGACWRRRTFISSPTTPLRPRCATRPRAPLGHRSSSIWCTGCRRSSPETRSRRAPPHSATR